jgi:hypothetical protein
MSIRTPFSVSEGSTAGGGSCAGYPSGGFLGKQGTRCKVVKARARGKVEGVCPGLSSGDQGRGDGNEWWSDDPR